VRLALDEHLSPAIAADLRERGVDVIAVVEVEELAGSADVVLLARMAAAGRVLVTADSEDFARLDHLLRQRGERHAGLLFLPPSRFDLRRGRHAPLVEALARFAVAHPGGIAGLVFWLQSPSG
jgi:hypothetical protein